MGLTETAFDLVEPCLQATCADWTPQHRYGVFEIPDGSILKLADALRREGAANSDRATALIFHQLSEWLELRAARGLVVSVLGL